MYKKHQFRPNVVTWRQFSNKGYSVFASLHRQVRIGVLSVATLAVAAEAHARLNKSVVVDAEEKETIDENAMAEVTVSGTLAPLTQLQSARIVSVLSRQDIEQAAVQSVNDLFKLATGVDVRQRGGFGIQTDISIDGGTFDQMTLLLNGIDIGNPQTGHLSADLPVSVNDIERIEILEGAASRVYGGQSFGGAINIVTRREKGLAGEVSARGGSYGTAEGEGRISIANGKTANRLSGSGGRSDGGMTNSSWRKGQLFYQGDYEGDGLKLDWQFGFSQKSYGANTFYSAAYPDQYERNRRFSASVAAETKGRFHFTPQVFWNRSYDNFELVRGTTFGENFHLTDAYGVKAGGYFNWKGGKTALSANVRHDNILSTNLGRDLDPENYVKVKGLGTSSEGHGTGSNGQGQTTGNQLYYTRSDNRTTVSFSLEHNVVLEHWTLSAGLMASMTSSIDHRFRFYPGVDVAYRPTSQWKFFFSYNKGFRLPTFTELYYRSPTHEGNRGLKPEHNHSLSLGLQHRWSGGEATARCFYHRGTQMIDWVMYAPDDIYHTAAFDLDNVGVQLQGRLSFPEMLKSDTWIRSLSTGYTYIHQSKHDAEGVYKSNYAMEYLRHKFTTSLTHRVAGRLSMSWDVRWQEREGNYMSGGELVGYHPYWMLDAKLQWQSSHCNLYVQANNLTCHRYYDLGAVPQPGFMVMAGARLRIF